MKVIWPENPFRQPRAPAAPRGVTSEEYGRQIGKSKGRARVRLEAMVEEGRAERLVTHAQNVNRTIVIRYVIKEQDDAMARTGTD